MDRNLRFRLSRPSANKLSTSNTVTISTAEYRRLVDTAFHFAKLKESLLSGGLSQQTLDLIIHGEPQPSPDVRQNGKEHPTRNQASPAHSYQDAPTGETQPGNTILSSELDEDEDTLTDSRSDDRDDDYGESSRSTESSSPRAEQRTVLIRGLPDRTTHRDIVDSVKGGAILHIYLWARDHTASVSFVEEAGAQNFLDHTRAYGFYVAEKRVEVLWNDRQFYLPPFVRAKIINGATRNLVIYNADPNITEGLIRRDLDHIHNLIVISVKSKHGNVYIQTNSVHNALFARSCMMSRLTYKGMKIAFSHDECAEPLAKIPTDPKRETSAAPVKKSAPLPNRFHLLSIEGSEDEEREDLRGW
ncbi:hypothetical protein BJX68DRAFT_42242 [Aspergillus pseudodeflectus]|uniref:RRM domain-containing protein n=1 Tax=Aspergillus pseudodeflectus TaxID=176178 RepID=A0ABR4J8M4_9EURO